jgi:hypothetical protein
MSTRRSHEDDLSRLRLALSAASPARLVPSSATVPDPDHAGGGAQHERGDHEPGQGVFLADPEASDGHVVGRGVTGQDPEGDVVVARRSIWRGSERGAIGIRQRAKQHPGLILGLAVRVGPVGGQERVKVELVDDVEHRPGRSASGCWHAWARGSRAGGLTAGSGRDPSAGTRSACCLRGSAAGWFLYGFWLVYAQRAGVCPRGRLAPHLDQAGHGGDRQDHQYDAERQQGRDFRNRVRLSGHLFRPLKIAIPAGSAAGPARRS